MACSSLSIIWENCLVLYFFSTTLPIAPALLAGSKRQGPQHERVQVSDGQDEQGCHRQIGHLEITSEFQISTITVPQAESLSFFFNFLHTALCVVKG